MEYMEALIDEKKIQKKGTLYWQSSYFQDRRVAHNRETPAMTRYYCREFENIKSEHEPGDLVYSKRRK